MDGGKLRTCEPEPEPAAPPQAKPAEDAEVVPSQALSPQEPSSLGKASTGTGRRRHPNRHPNRHARVTVDASPTRHVTGQDELLTSPGSAPATAAPGEGQAEGAAGRSNSHKRPRRKSEKRSTLSIEERESLRVAQELQKSLNGLRTTRAKAPSASCSITRTEIKAKKAKASNTSVSTSPAVRKQYLKELLASNKVEYIRQFQLCKSIRYHYAPGTLVFAKLGGHCFWPGAIWHLNLCPSSLQKKLFETYVPGYVLIRSYGDMKMSWYKPHLIHVVLDRREIQEENSVNMKKCKKWAYSKGKLKLYELLLKDLSEISPVATVECQRICQYQRSQVTNGEDDTCMVCGEGQTNLTCERCSRCYHDICLNLFFDDEDKDAERPQWQCSMCHFIHRNDNDDKFERLGLTPDWLIHEAAFNVFQLPQPTVETPYIKGLLDPCTNSKVTPNIPAEVLYDKKDDGLDSKNSWKGYFIILNPEYKAKILWRFINRAIDEVENGNCPVIVVVCRNSTDANYFHRLTPYPRILLRRKSIHFKDYDSTPIGFGIVVFCLAKDNGEVYFRRFYDSFSQYGEMNMPIDRALITHPVFYSLLSRLQMLARQTQRDHWICCDVCHKWRLVSLEEKLSCEKSPEKGWTCSQHKTLRDRGGCSVPQSAFEMEAQEWHMYSIKSAENRMLTSQREAGRGQRVSVQNKDVEDKDKGGSLKHLLPMKKFFEGALPEPAQATEEESAPQTAQGTALTSLELARMSRIAGNKHIMQKLGLYIPGKVRKDRGRATQEAAVKSGSGAAERDANSNCLPCFLELQKAKASYKTLAGELQEMCSKFDQEKVEMNQRVLKMNQRIWEKQQEVFFLKNKVKDLDETYHNRLQQ